MVSREHKHIISRYQKKLISRVDDFEAHPFPAKKHARFMIGNNFATTKMPRYSGNKASFPA